MSAKAPGEGEGGERMDNDGASVRRRPIRERPGEDGEHVGSPLSGCGRDARGRGVWRNLVSYRPRLELDSFAPCSAVRAYGVRPRPIREARRRPRARGLTTFGVWARRARARGVAKLGELRSSP